MNDAEILDKVCMWLDRHNTELALGTEEISVGEAYGMRDWILSKRNDADLQERIRKEVARQLKAQNKTGHRDVKAVGKSKEQQERIKNIRDIIRELEREAGSAHIDTIVERASKLGFEKDKVEAEIVRLLQEAAIFEPVRYSRNYRTSQQ